MVSFGSPDLRSGFRKIGTDPRLQGNIHGIVVFKHKGKSKIALAQSDDQRVLMVSMDGNVEQQLDAPKGTWLTLTRPTRITRKRSLSKFLGSSQRYHRCTQT